MISRKPAKKIIETAEQTARDCGCNNIPIDVDLILDLKDISLIPAPGIGDDGFCSRNFDLIYYDPLQPEFRTRFTVAHELGHCVLHKDYLQQNFDLHWTDFSEWLNFLDQIDPFDEREMETQANIFASHLLIPETPLIDIAAKEMPKIRAAIERAKASGLAQEDIEEKARDMLAREIAQKFEVSASAMFYRLKYSGIQFW